jgi:ATP-dependent RNA helicase DDX3X
MAAKYVPPHARRTQANPARQQPNSRPTSFARTTTTADGKGTDKPPGTDDTGSNRFARPPPDAGPKYVAASPASRFARSDGGSEKGAPRRASARNPRLEQDLFGPAISNDAPDRKGAEAATKEAEAAAAVDDAVPVEVSGEDAPAALESFAAAKLDPVLELCIELCRYTKPTPIQKHAIPVALQQRDLIACAQTGSGKTAAFLLPTIHQMMQSAPPQSSSFASGGQRGGYGRQRAKLLPRCLILAPTRELVMQIHAEACKFTYRTGLRAALAYGGQPPVDQLRDLERGCDIVVATPGRLKDFIDRGRMSLAEIKTLILDEADRMLDMGFEPQIRAIVQEADLPADRQTLMFSATFPKEIQRLASDFLTNYIFCAIGRVGSTTENITQRVMFVEERDKRSALLELLPECDGLTLVFVATKRSADALEAFIEKEGVHAISIHGDRSQSEREEALALFRSGKCPVLVATDVASRGLDIPDVRNVINFDLPTTADIDSYVHRIGRTGRCGKTGIATSFMNEQNGPIARELAELLAESKQEIPAWLQQLSRGGGGRGRGGRGGGRGGWGRGWFGGRDFRRNDESDTPASRPMPLRARPESESAATPVVRKTFETAASKSRPGIADAWDE